MTIGQDLLLICIFGSSDIFMKLILSVSFSICRVCVPGNIIPSIIRSFSLLTYAFGGSSTPLSLFVTVDLRGAFQDIQLGFAAESNNVSKSCLFRVAVHEHVIVHTNKRTLLSWGSTTQHMRRSLTRRSPGFDLLSYPHKLERLHPSLPQSIAGSLCD